jgi:hypothetical protein
MKDHRTSAFSCCQEVKCWQTWCSLEFNHLFWHPKVLSSNSCHSWSIDLPSTLQGFKVPTNLLDVRPLALSNALCHERQTHSLRIWLVRICEMAILRKFWGEKILLFLYKSWQKSSTPSCFKVLGWKLGS